MPVTQSRLNLARAAVRPSMRGKMLLSGPSGAGKTFTALTIGEVLAGSEGRILVIDTEKESALTYADLFEFAHIRWAAPFDPRELADTLKDAGATYDVVIVDSFTHFWRGNGGILDIANGKFTGWKDARPAQVDVVEAVLEADAHVICCVRSKMAHAQEERNGKQVVVKLGMAPEQDDDFEYEVNVSIEMDMQHSMQVGKSRTNAVPVGRTFHAGHAADFATTYRDWLKAGEPVAERAKVDEMVGRLNGITDQAEKVKAKHHFLELFGRPEFLLESRFVEAEQWVIETITDFNAATVATAGEAGDPEGDPADAPVPTPVPDNPAPVEPPQPRPDTGGEEVPSGEPPITTATAAKPKSTLRAVDGDQQSLSA